MDDHQQIREGLGNFDSIVFDEAHALVDSVADFMSVELSQQEILKFLKASSHPDELSPISKWREAAISWMEPLANSTLNIMEEVRFSGDNATRDLLKSLSHASNLKTKLITLSEMKDDEWVVEATKYGFRFDPIWPAKYTEEVLFRGIQHINLVSATIRPKTLDLLGVKPEESEYIEYPAVFDPRNSPLYFLEGWPDMSQRARKKSSDSMSGFISATNDIIRPRQDRKGIVHTISFELAQQFMNESDYSRNILSNSSIYAGGSRRTDEQVELFRNSTPGAIFCSPSIATGWDFPGDICRYQIISKLPYPANMQTAVAKKRKQLDSEWFDYQAANSLAQACGRATRSESDWCENFITDSRIKFFMWKKKHLFPSYFEWHYKRVHRLPEPPPVTS